MTQSHEALCALVSNEVINVNDFYSIGYRPRAIQLQGSYTPQLVKDFNALNMESTTQIDTVHGYVTINFVYLDIHVEVTLT